MIKLGNKPFLTSIHVPVKNGAVLRTCTYYVLRVLERVLFLTSIFQSNTLEVSVLVSRCLFPLHPIAAAIQSIGVICRDLEGDTSYGLGRIFFHAFLYHGSFDFALMILSDLSSFYSFEEMTDYDTVQK